MNFIVIFHVMRCCETSVGNASANKYSLLFSNCKINVMILNLRLVIKFD